MLYKNWAPGNLIIILLMIYPNWTFSCLPPEKLWKLWRLCDPSWHRHHGLHGLSPVLHVWTSGQTDHSHWLAGRSCCPQEPVRQKDKNVSAVCFLLLLTKKRAVLRCLSMKWGTMAETTCWGRCWLPASSSFPRWGNGDGTCIVFIKW